MPSTTAPRLDRAAIFGARLERVLEIGVREELVVPVEREAAEGERREVRVVEREDEEHDDRRVEEDDDEGEERPE